MSSAILSSNPSRFAFEKGRLSGSAHTRSARVLSFQAVVLRMSVTGLLGPMVVGAAGCCARPERTLSESTSRDSPASRRNACTVDRMVVTFSRRAGGTGLDTDPWWRHRVRFVERSGLLRSRVVQGEHGEHATLVRVCTGVAEGTERAEPGGRILSTDPRRHTDPRPSTD